MSKTREIREEQVNFLKNHPDPCPLNFFMEFKYRKKLSGYNDYILRLDKALQDDPTSEKGDGYTGDCDFSFRTSFREGLYELILPNPDYNDLNGKSFLLASRDILMIINHEFSLMLVQMDMRTGRIVEVNPDRIVRMMITSFKRRNKRTNEQANNHDVQYVFANTMAFPALKEYCKILNQLKDHHLEEESQRGRHLLKLLTWSVVDSKLFPAQDPMCYPDLRKPAVNFNIIIAALKDTRHKKLWDAIPVLNRIIKEGKIGIVQSSIISTIQCWLGLEPANFVIDAPTTISALTSVLLFVPSPVRPGAHPSENHFKSQLWTKILSDTFFLNIDQFEPIWELHHQIPGDSGKGSARSDFACVVISPITKEQYPFFILEFEVGGVQIHKDFAVVVAEAVHALSRILSTHVILESEISLIRVHVALVNNAHIRLGILRPLYNQGCNDILYIYDQDIKSFDLQSDYTGINIENVFNLIVYLRQVVCKDGLYLRNLLNRRNSEKKRKFYSGLPRLPSDAEKSRVPKGNFTPMAKRIKYELYSDGNGDDSHNSSSHYRGNSMLPEESSSRNINQQVVGEIDSS
ncbi:hypothetical protein Glove_193g51 [Diversispora epigaea]|uniref:Uncharacterized protein n=1 Tax=Diversispora epigaea TaxID=1348612 RepID=A0A397ILJ3_9GLOM|nr:hypothetical protein Glove_193g51 [Diversispora epigaea]